MKPWSDEVDADNRGDEGDAVDAVDEEAVGGDVDRDVGGDEVGEIAVVGFEPVVLPELGVGGFSDCAAPDFEPVVASGIEVSDLVTACFVASACDELFVVEPDLPDDLEVGGFLIDKATAVDLPVPFSEA